MKLCRIEDCTRIHKAKGLCQYHYNEARALAWRSSARGRTYHVWYLMNYRCKQTSGHYYKYYGARGIKVCKRWELFDNFLEDMGYQPARHEIDRRDNDKGYNQDNCRWVTRRVNAQNKRNNHYVTVDGEVKTLSEWSRIVGMTPSGLRDAVNKKGAVYIANKLAL